MSIRNVLVVAALCAVLCVCVGIAAQPAYAQDGIKGGADKKLGTQQGLEVLKNSGKKDKPTASPVQMAVGVGSIFVTVAIVKWL